MNKLSVICSSSKTGTFKDLVSCSDLNMTRLGVDKSIPRHLDLDNGTLSKIDDVLPEHGGVSPVLPTAVNQIFQVKGNILRHFYSLGFVVRGPFYA